MNRLSITIKKLNAIVVDVDGITLKGEPTDSKVLLTSINAQMQNLGFVMSQTLFDRLSQTSQSYLIDLNGRLVKTLAKLKGGDKQYQPMYPNFPEQVQNMHEASLYWNALTHYWSTGAWLPSYKTNKRTKKDENSKLIEIGLVSNDDFEGIFTNLLATNESLSEEDKNIVNWFLQTKEPVSLIYPDDIPFAENRCLVTAAKLKQGADITSLIKSATDILRVATFMSGGDVSLATNTKFKSLNRKVRKTLVKTLEKVIREEDIGRHRNKWGKLFHNLHVGDYSKTVFDIAQKVRNNQPLAGFNSKVERLLSAKNIDDACRLLAKRPGEFCRRLDHLVRLSDSAQMNQVCSTLDEVAKQVPTRNLLQLLGHLQTRDKDSDTMIVFPKGSIQSAVVVDRAITAMNAPVQQNLIGSVESALQQRFAEQDGLGKVWIDPRLVNCPIPSQQRSASSALFNVARGTRLPMGDDKDTLRFFIYWKGQDIDLSATFHNRNFGIIEQISYTNLRQKKYDAYHSGDITSARNGACEFIDISIDKALKYGARYVTMNVLVYSGPNFSQHEVCYAGWMTRAHPNSNEVFDAATVEQKIDVRSDCRNVIPVVFDLLRREVIWVDLTTKQNTRFGGNNVESNQASIEEKIEAMVKSDNKVSLYQLFAMHGQARGEMVDEKVDADTVFALDEGIGPYDITKINSQFTG